MCQSRHAENAESGRSRVLVGKGSQKAGNRVQSGGCDWTRRDIAATEQGKHRRVEARSAKP